MRLDTKTAFACDGFKENYSFLLDFSQLVYNGIMPFKPTLKVNALLQNRAGVVTLKTDVSFEYHTPCDRCRKDTIKNFDYSFMHTLVLSQNNENTDDYIEVPDFILDLNELVKDDILLELPGKFLCDDDCRGLCPICGSDLNIGQCGCKAESIDPRLLELSKLITDSNL